MRNHKTQLLLAELFLVCMTQCVLYAGTATSREYTGDFVLHREIPANLVAGTPEHPRLVEVPWVRVETVYGNCWRVTACVGWSAAAEMTWRIRIELLDDEGGALRHARDRPTTFTCQTEQSNPGVVRRAELALEPMHWEGRRHAAKIRVHLEPAEEPAAAARSAGAGPKPLEITAIDSKSNKPLPDAIVIVKAGFSDTQYWSHTSLLATDAQGRCRVAPEGADLVSLSVTLQKEGYATMMKGWSNPSSWPIDRVPLVDLPERHVMKMEPARTLGGVVQDQAGQPIPEAQVRIEAHLEEAGGTAYVSRSLLTDKEGRWQVEGIPSEADTVSVGFKHLEYLSDTWASRHVTGEDLLAFRDRKHVVKMARGLTVSGRVLDEQGRPLARAAVVLAPAYSSGFHYEHAYTLSDASGQFRFGCAGNDLTNTTPEGGSTGVLVEAPGYVPALRRVIVEPNLAPLEFRLSRGQALTVRVVDANDRPIVGAMPVIHPLPEDPRNGYWLADTDQQGRFQILHAPEKDMLLTVLKSGYVGVRDYPLPVSRDEPVVKMRPAPRIQGTVRDAQTGELIQDFLVGTRYEVGANTRDGEPSRFTGGKFELTIDEARPESLQLKVLAAGYAPTTSETIRLEGTHILEFKLTKDPSFDARAVQRAAGEARSSEALVIEGTVVDPNGRPAPRVAVGVLPFYARETATDAEGKFKLRCPSRGPSMGEEVPYIIARDRQRNLAVAVEFDPAATEDLTIRLVPGVILAGRVTDADGKGIPGTQISLTFWTGRMGHGLREEAARLDPDGSYEIRAVPRDQHYSVEATAEGYGRDYIDARPTEAVNNRMTLEPMILKRANLEVSGTVVDGEDNPVSGASVYCYGRGQSNQQVKTDSQGRFKALGICAGPVQIQANIRGERTLFGRTETQGGAIDVKIVLRPMGGAGQYAPPRPPSLVGKPLPSVADLGISLPADAYKDKMVLLCFFDLGQRPSRHCVTTLARQVDDLKAKGVVVLAIQAAEADAAALAQWKKEQGTALPVGVIQGDSKKVRSSWGVASLPWLILTDKDRIVRAEGFGLDELQGRIKSVAKEQRTAVCLVKDAQGAALAREPVIVHPMGTKHQTDGEGRFSIQYALPTDSRGLYVHVRHKDPDLIGAVWLPQTGGDLEVILMPAVSVQGHVIDPNGRPVVGAQVAALPMSNQYVLTEAAGAFDIAWSREWEPPNGLCLMARHVQSNLAALVAIERQTRTVTIRLEPALMLAGAVEDEDDRPVTGVSVGISLRNHWACGTPVEPVTTDAAGRYVFQALPQNQEYLIYANAPSYWAQGGTTGVINNRPVVAEAGRIVLKRPILTLSGIVVDVSDAPVSGIKVGSGGVGQPERTAETDAQGRFTLQGLCRGPVEIWAKLDRILYGTAEAEAGRKNVRIVVRPIP